MSIRVEFGSSEDVDSCINKEEGTEMLKRKAYARLLEWKKSSRGRSALMIEGARRFGKTTLVKQFALDQYESHVYIDFNRPQQKVKEIFEEYGNDEKMLLSMLSVHFGVPFSPRNTLIIFDEVQNYPMARSYLKYFVEDGRYDFIATGSLLSIKRNVKDIILPSEVDSLELNPLDFEEFLEAIGNVPLKNLLMGHLQSLTPLPSTVHSKAMKHFREYMVIGGMPKVVQKYIDSLDFMEVDHEKRRILKLYRDDIIRYADGHEGRVTAIFDEIPAQLSQAEKKFTLASLEKNARMRDYEEAFFWLFDAKIINPCYNSKDPNVGLGLNLDRIALKCYMADTGLLVTHAFADRDSPERNLYQSILFDKLGVNEGMIVENMISQIFHAAGRKLFFYSRHDRDNRANTMEIDFLIVRDDGLKPKITPVEVKSGKRYSTVSLDKFKRKFGSRVKEEIVLHPGNISKEGNRIKLPLYLAPWL